jgi:hAT family C-terminal dimerisation region
LDFRHVPFKHSGVNLAEHVLKVLHEYQIFDKLYCITTDNASNNTKMIKVMECELKEKDDIIWSGMSHHIPCLAHSINLAIRDFLRVVKVRTLSEEVDLITVRKTQSQVEEDRVEEDGDEEDQERSDADELDSSDLQDSDLSIGRVIQKLRTIAKTTNFPQSRILAFQRACDVANVRRMRLIRDQATRWSATFNMLERAIFLRKAIHVWTQSSTVYSHLILSDSEWDMAEFLLHFLRPFTIVNTLAQGNIEISLPDTWIHYEEMFDALNETRDALEAIKNPLEWMDDVKEGIEAMWQKFRKYYDRTGKPFAFIDGTILHPARKVKWIKKTYGQPYAVEYVQQCRQRFERSYSGEPMRTPSGRKRKADEANISDNSSDEGFADELEMWLKTNRDKTVTNPIKWWSQSSSRSMYPDLSKMARDVYAVPPSSAGVEREFSISGRVITKQRNRLAPTTIRDLMQTKRWIARKGLSKTDNQEEELEDEIGNDEEPLESEEKVNKELAEWLENWERKMELKARVAQLGRRK